MIRSAAALLLVAASTPLASSAPAGPVDVPVDMRLRQARAEATAAEAEQRRLEKAAEAARDELERIRAQQLAAAQAIAAAEARISAAEAETRLVQAYLEAQRQRLAAQQSPASALLSALFFAGSRPPILFLAGSASPEELVKLQLLAAAITPSIQARTASLVRELDRGSRLEEAALAARESMLRSRDELERRRTAFAELEARALRLAEERGAQALGAADLALARQEQLSEAESRSLSGGAAARTARELAAHGPAPLPGVSAETPAVPIAYRLPAEAAVTEGLGEISPNGVRSRGIVFATRRGARLVAPATGTILFAGPFRDYDGVIIIDHGGGWRSVIVNAGSGIPRGGQVRMGEPLGTALGPVEVQLQHRGRGISPAIIAGSSAMLSNMRKGG